MNYKFLLAYAFLLLLVTTDLALLPKLFTLLYRSYVAAILFSRLWFESPELPLYISS